MPSNFGTPVKQVKRLPSLKLRQDTYQSEVAAGGIARFITTRLCCSQMMLIHHLFQTSFSGISYNHVTDCSKSLNTSASPRQTRLHVGAYTPSPALHLSGLSSTFM